MVNIDLHCHLDGSLSVSCISELLGRPVAAEELQAGWDCPSLAQYLQKFDLPLEGLQTREGLYRAGLDFMKSSAQQHLDYVEVRFAPLLSIQSGLNCRQVIESLLSGLEKGKEQYGIDYGVITCVMRHHPQETSRKMLLTAREYLGCGVCGADLAGDEASFGMAQFVELFSWVKRMHIPFTIHAGECGYAENIKEAVLCGAQRIGHGIAMRKRKDIQELCRERRIGIEMCPISNIQTKAIADVSEYPMRKFLDSGLLVTMNTDNRTVSQTTLDQEWDFVKNYADICENDRKKMTEYAIETAFASDDVKHRLWKRMGRSTTL